MRGIRALLVSLGDIVKGATEGWWPPADIATKVSTSLK